jgi:hypothetical protein
MARNLLNASGDQNVAVITDRSGTLIGINLDNLSGPDFAKIKGRLKNVRDHILFDSLRFKPATAWAPQTHKMFQTANGQSTTVANDATLAYLKDDSDTNLFGQGGNLPQGDFFTVQSIMVSVAIAENEFTTVLNNGSTINATPLVTVVLVGDGADTQVLAMTQNTVLKFYVDDTRLYENGTIDYFPQGFGYTGWNGGGAGGIAQNGGVLPRMLARARHLKELQRFVIEIVNTKTITLPVSCRLKVGLWGALYVPVG